MCTVDLAAEEVREDTLLAAGLYNGMRLLRLQATFERRVPMAALPRLGPPSLHRDRNIGEEEAEGVSEEAPGIPAAPTPCGAAG